MNVTVSPTELKIRCNNPVTQHESKNTFSHLYELTSCVDYTTGSLIKNLCAYVLILFYVTTTLNKSFYSGKHTDFENENKEHRLNCRCLPRVVYLTFAIIALDGQVQHMHQSGSLVHASDLTSLVDNLPRET